MKRYNYGQNYSAIQSSKFTAMAMLGTLEVAPGDTISGRITPEVWTDTTLRPILNRTYFDTFAFYVPYRLLWEQFPEFISQVDETLTPPTIDDPQPFYMEHPVLPGGTCLAWNRRAYNLIYNRYFRLAENDDAALDSPFGAFAAQRESTFHESCLPEGTISDTDVQIDVINESVSVNDLRTAFAEDKFTKIRQYYGTKYTDYLASMGVKASWSISDDPELIGKSNHDLVYRNVNTTVSDGLDPNQGFTGDSAGYFTGKKTCNIKPTFCPEHGIIVYIGVARMDMPNVSGSATPHLTKDGRVAYYSPEYETRRVRGWQGSLFGDNNSESGEARLYEEYRKPVNQYGQYAESVNEKLLYVATWDDPNAKPEDYRIMTSEVFDPLFTGTMGGPGSAVHYTVHTECRLLRKSPVRPPQRISGVS